MKHRDFRFLATSLALCTLLMASLASTADALLICAKDDGNGHAKEKSKLVLKSACTAGKEVRVGTSEALALSGSCPQDSVAVGTACVDKYEASVWEVLSPSTIQAIRDGTITSPADIDVGIQRGMTGDDYGTECPDTAAGCTNFFAISMPNVMPAAYITWFQAAAACRNSGKRLATNVEWQAAAYGTPDPGTDNGTTDCFVSGDFQGNAVPTGSRSGCVSNAGARDMVGNVAEWIADWSDAAWGCTTWTAQTGLIPGGDLSCFSGPGSYGGSTIYSLPVALIRGGPFYDDAYAGVFAVQGGFLFNQDAEFGFRCAR